MSSIMVLKWSLMPSSIQSSKLQWIQERDKGQSQGQCQQDTRKWNQKQIHGMLTLERTNFTGCLFQPHCLTRKETKAQTGQLLFQGQPTDQAPRHRIPHTALSSMVSSAPYIFLQVKIHMQSRRANRPGQWRSLKHSPKGWET